VTLAGTYVGLCDWLGCVVWKSEADDRLQIGDELWKNAAGRSRESLRIAVASAVTLRENRTLDVEDEWNEYPGLDVAAKRSGDSLSRFCNTNSKRAGASYRS
jgi:hypothetical protein